MTASAPTPGPERLNAAVGLIVERLAPDQIILFGSGARGEMTGKSDLDLLVIKDDDGHDPLSARHERWRCPSNGDQLDVVVMTRAAAERYRMSASYVQGAALEEGRTLYLREGVTPTATGPVYTWNGVAMVKTTQFEPDHAAELLDKARRKWVDANRTEHPADRCEYLPVDRARVQGPHHGPRPARPARARARRPLGASRGDQRARPCDT